LAPVHCPSRKYGPFGVQDRSIEIDLSCTPNIYLLLLFTDLLEGNADLCLKCNVLANSDKN
jgi:hypothetical protein